MKKQKFTKIYIKDWIKLKPYKKQVKSDIYYLKLANKLKELLVREFTDKDGNFDVFLESDDEITLLSCFLTSYFEDIISGTNIWNTFVKKHKELYNKELPFYEIDEDYIHGEINHQDISFLLWYFTNTIKDEYITHPYNIIFDLLPIRIMNIFEAEYETAPENEHLKEYYQVNPNDADLYSVRDVLSALLLSTYLFYPDTSLRFGYQIEETLIEAYERKENQEDIMLLLRETEIDFLTTTPTKLLNFKGNEWIAALLGEQHPLYQDILNSDKRIVSLFFYKGNDENHVFLEHIASSIPFNLSKKSINSSFPKKNDIDAIILIGIQQWQGEWWFSGNAVGIPFNADLILNEKNSIAARKSINFILLAENEAEIKEMLAKREKAFLEITNGSHILFLLEKDVEKFQIDFMNYCNESLNESLKFFNKKKKEETLKQIIKERYFGDKDNYSESYKNTLASDEVESVLLFFNPKRGNVEVAFGINSAFPTATNPFYNEDDCIEHTFELLTNPVFSKELVHYCVDNFKDKSIFFEKFGDDYMNDLDFILRFYKEDNYFTQPQITLKSINDVAEKSHLKVL